MSQNSCCVPGCAVVRKDGVHLHRFPNPETSGEKFTTWILNIGGEIAIMDHQDIYDNRRVCVRHFEDIYKYPSGRLSKLAIPTMHIPDLQAQSLSEAMVMSKSDTSQRSQLQKCGFNTSAPTTSPLVPDSQPSTSQEALLSNRVIQHSTTVNAVENKLGSDNKMAPILYKTDASPPSNAVRILADIIGLELELRDCDFGTLEHKSPEHVKMNPMGTVPTLVDGDFVISESHATMKYLLSVYGSAKSESLYPSDVRTRSLVDQAMFFNVGIYFIRLKVIVLPAVFGDLDGPTEKHKADIDEAYGVVEAYLANNKYIVTDHLTIADLSVGATTVAFQYLYKLDAARFPRTAAWLARLEEHPSFKKILIPGSKILGEVVNAAWQANKKQ